MDAHGLIGAVCRFMEKTVIALLLNAPLFGHFCISIGQKPQNSVLVYERHVTKCTGRYFSFSHLFFRISGPAGFQ